LEPTTQHIANSETYSFPITRWLTIVYALVAPFFVFSVVLSRDTASLWIIGAMLIVFLLDFSRRGGSFWIDRSVYWLLIVVLLYGLATCVTLMNDSPVRWAGKAPFERALGIDARLLAAAIAYFVFINILVGLSEKDFLAVFKAQVIVGILISVFGLIQYLNFEVFGSTALAGIESTNEAFKTRSNFISLTDERIFRASSVYSEPSYFGFFLVPLVTKLIVSYNCGLHLFSRNVHILFIVVVLAAIGVNYSVTAIAALVFVGILMGFFSIGKILQFSGRIVLVTCVLVAVLFVTPVGGFVLDRITSIADARDISSIERLVRAYTGTLVFLEHPWFGVGPGGFAFLYPKLGLFVEQKTMHTPLNLWLTVLTDVGIIGFLPFTGFLVSIVIRGWRNLRKNPLVQIFFWSIVSYLVLLTSVDLWFIDMLWFEFAMLAVLGSMISRDGENVGTGKVPA